jgi:hypothetical protein
MGNGLRTEARAAISDQGAKASRILTDQILLACRPGATADRADPRFSLGSGQTAGSRLGRLSGLSAAWAEWATLDDLC